MAFGQDRQERSDLPQTLGRASDRRPVLLGMLSPGGSLSVAASPWKDLCSTTEVRNLEPGCVLVIVDLALKMQFILLSSNLC